MVTAGQEAFEAWFLRHRAGDAGVTDQLRNTARRTWNGLFDTEKARWCAAANDPAALAALDTEYCTPGGEMKGKWSRLRIEVREYREERPNGDRASHLSPSSRFEIVLLAGASPAPSTSLATYDQYDNFRCGIDGTRDQFYARAMKYAKGVAHVINTEIPDANVKVTHVEFVEEVKRNWKESARRAV